MIAIPDKLRLGFTIKRCPPQKEPRQPSIGPGLGLTFRRVPALNASLAPRSRLKSTLRVFRSNLAETRTPPSLPCICPSLVFAVGFAQPPSSSKKTPKARFGDLRQPQFLLIEPRKRCRRQTEGRGTRSPRRLAVPHGKLRLRKWSRVPCSTSRRQLRARAMMRSWETFLRLCGRCRTARARSLPVDLRRARP